jgi:hypothetical protein
MQERRTDISKRERFNTVRAALIERLRRVCADWPQRELDQLSAKMARLQLKYEAWTGMPGRDGNRSDPLGA